MSPVIPSTLPFLPLRNGVLFPGTTITLPMGRKRSLELLKHVQVKDLVVVGVQKNPKDPDPGFADLFPVATLARVKETQLRGREGRLEVEGLSRVHLESLAGVEPYWRVAARHAEEPAVPAAAAERLTGELARTLEELGPLPEGFEEMLRSDERTSAPGRFADRVAAALGLNLEHEVEILTMLDGEQRLRRVQELLSEAQSRAEVRAKIESEVRRELGKSQRQAILREQLRAIKKELGEDDEATGELAGLKKKLDEAELPEEVRSIADRELARLEEAGNASPERGIIRSYLELIAALPWSRRAAASLDLDKVAAQLDADHYGLTDVKKRILEHLAVLKVVGRAKGTILCLVGPPGVGKTSLGQSIADATGRPFVRVALGGVRDEAEIRGHRRTYVGALPGRILHGMKKAGVKNPVFLLDEIDKLAGSGWAGWPEAALLEVLDPEQNKSFQDHYLEQPFDLSEVLFVCTANTLETLSPPLRDRLEIIEVSGYTLDEKLHIAKRHLVPKQLLEHGLDGEALSLSDDALKRTVTAYTREAGVRQLERQITKLCRAVTLAVVQRSDATPAQPVRVEAKDLRTYLGREKFFDEIAERLQLPGVATGLAWTPTGGDILFVETSRMRGKGKIEITGQLGDVMKESARAALSYVRANAETLGVDPEFLDKQDLHIHVPAGAVPKDGPSAGVTMFTAITSLLTGLRVRSDTAMTGECTLRGRVLPVGGIKEKVLAAHRAGLSRIILPKKNEQDLEEVPEAAKKDLTFILAEDMSQVLDAALEAVPLAELSGSAGSAPSTGVQPH